jgi:hypothetical protein
MSVTLLTLRSGPNRHAGVTLGAQRHAGVTFDEDDDEGDDARPQAACIVTGRR